MKLKKLLAVLCVCAMVFALVLPVFAADDDDDATSGSIKNPLENDFVGSNPDSSLTVSVAVLKGDNKLYVNPYGLPYTIPDKKVALDQKPIDESEEKADIKEGTTTAGWFSTTSLVQNRSNGALKVSVTMTTTEHGDVKVVKVGPGDTVPTSATVSNNTLYGELRLAKATYDADNGTITPDWTAATGDMVTIPVPAGADTPNQKGTPDVTSVLDVGFTLDAAGTRYDPSTQTDVTSPSYAAFQIRGNAVMAPGASSGDIGSWDKADLADVTVAFSFET